ncbi:hypothetical protein SH580_03525 [Coraliomargarita algicola]|uniref:PEP-CTERM protein-sorting domain-containing protein n=1 Tax=Coraliomargarita algicola TaxID=3092156 RepID=A0ABZ0RP75_9BACT|nr:hypothetical protein [Coraliomargarita sp. J2-16]WPJ96775.1 hypothetical protein SH580_03525 [Coraliomargarita sp. J2-16]
MKHISILGLTLYALTASNAQTTIFDHDFTDYAGEETDALNGTTVDGGTATWSVGGSSGDGPNFIYADGDVSTRGGAALAYAFTTGVYELSVGLTVDSGFSGIGFTSSNPVAGSYFSESWATIGLRASGDFEFWEGIANNNANDGGNLGDDYSGSNTNPITGTLRMVLDWNDTTNVGTITGYFTADGGSEIQVDLDDQTVGVNGNSISVGSDLTGIILQFDGRTDQGNSYQYLTLTSIPEPSSFAFVGGLLAFGLVSMRRRR